MYVRSIVMMLINVIITNLIIKFSWAAAASVAVVENSSKEVAAAHAATTIISPPHHAVVNFKGGGVSSNTEEEEEPAAPQHHYHQHRRRNLKSSSWSPYLTNETKQELLFVPDEPQTLSANKVTTYFCVFYEVPADQDYHVVGWEAVIPPVSQRTLHHSIMMTCRTRDTPWGAYIGARPVTNGQRVPCEPMPPSACDTMIGGWTPGGWGNGPNGAFRTPSDAGFRVGPGRKFVVVQYHHNNESLDANNTSQAGFRLQITPDLRKADVGEMQLGPIAVGFAIPPARRNKNNDDDDVVDVVHTCTWNADPTDAWAFRSHAHALCTRQYSIVRRSSGNDTNDNVAYLGDTSPFTYHSQPLVGLDPPTRIERGDVLETHCLYERGERWTAGGLSTSDEMCIRHVLISPDVERAGAPFCWGRITETAGWSEEAQRSLEQAHAEYARRQL